MGNVSTSGMQIADIRQLPPSCRSQACPSWQSPRRVEEAANTDKGSVHDRIDGEVCHNNLGVEEGPMDQAPDSTTISRKEHGMYHDFMGDRSRWIAHCIWHPTEPP